MSKLTGVLMQIIVLIVLQGLMIEHNYSQQTFFGDCFFYPVQRNLNSAASDTVGRSFWSLMFETAILLQRFQYSLETQVEKVVVLYKVQCLETSSMLSSFAYSVKFKFRDF